MKFTSLKSKKNRLPPVKSLRSSVFDVDKSWFMILISCLVVFIITALIGFNLTYSQYFESYKESQTVDSYENLININRLEKTINQRDDFVNKEVSLPKDPSM